MLRFDTAEGLQSKKRPKFSGLFFLNFELHQPHLEEAQS